ncbi:MAG: adenylate/guanylate cyclase domain-containing protein [Crocinitomicaceae bacterium]
MIFKIISLIILITICLVSYGQTGEDVYNQAQGLLDQGKKRKASQLFEEALYLAEVSEDLDLQLDCHLALAELKNNIIDYKEALDHYKDFGRLYKEKVITAKRTLQDSVIGLNSNIKESRNIIKVQDKSLDSLETEHINAQLDITKLELEKQKNLGTIQAAQNRRNILLLVLGIVFLLSVFMIRSYFLKRKHNQALIKMNSIVLSEKKKSDELLLNILPKKIAKELKEKGKAKSMRYDQATVLFTDFKGFTKFSENKKPEDIVSILDYYFGGFDKILSEFNIEKIKTIGDAYLCVSGLPETDTNQVRDMILCAKKMIAFVQKAKIDEPLLMKDSMEIRIGIHCGPVVAGIVGTKKFAYDIWGDTVNIAARMEQSGVPSEINVSEAIYKKMKAEFNFEFRGEIEAKNKGKMKMYLLK